MNDWTEGYLVTHQQPSIGSMLFSLSVAHHSSSLLFLFRHESHNRMFCVCDQTHLRISADRNSQTTALTIGFHFPCAKTWHPCAELKIGRSINDGRTMRNRKQFANCMTNNWHVYSEYVCAVYSEYVCACVVHQYVPKSAYRILR